MRRELRLVKDETVLSWVDDNESPPLGRVAADVLSGPIREDGEAETVRRILREGWSNGYVYFAEATP